MQAVNVGVCSTERRRHQPPREREPDAAARRRHVEPTHRRRPPHRRQLRARRAGRALLLHALPHAERDESDTAGGSSPEGLLRHMSDSRGGRKWRQRAAQLLAKRHSAQSGDVDAGVDGGPRRVVGHRDEGTQSEADLTCRDQETFGANPQQRLENAATAGRAAPVSAASGTRSVSINALWLYFKLTSLQRAYVCLAAIFNYVNTRNCFYSTVQNKLIECMCFHFGRYSTWQQANS